MKLPDGMVQIASQVGNRLRTDRLTRQRGHHAAHLTRRDDAQKGLANQYRHLRRPTLELVQTGGKEALLPGACNPQPEGTEAGHKVPLVIAVAISGRRPRASLVGLVAHRSEEHTSELQS